MKKIITTILCLVLMLSTLSACNSERNRASGSNELVIDTFLENRFLEYAAQKYEEMHEGVKITINNYSSNFERDSAKYSQIINTALMSGSGADIIDVGYINWVALADSNRLLDLNGRIEFSPEEHYINILDAYLYNGKRYAIPLNFYFRALGFSEAFSGKETLDSLTLDGLLSLSAKYPENPLIASSFGLDNIGLAHYMFALNFNSYIDVRNKTANVDNEMFISMLKNITSMNNLRPVEPGEAALMWEYSIYNPTMNSNYISDYTDMFLITNDNGDNLCMSSGFLPAVNANSANKELAVDFIRFLLSEEIQSSPELGNNPINKKSSAEVAALILAEARAGGFTDSFDLEKNIGLFNEFAERLNVVETSDSFIIRFLREELTRYFNGEVSAEQAARNLHTRLNTYLKE